MTTSTGYPPLPDSPPLSAGQPDEVKSFLPQSSSTNERGSTDQALEHLGHIGDGDATNQAPSLEDEHANEAAFPTEPLVVNGGMEIYEASRSVRRQSVFEQSQDNSGFSVAGLGSNVLVAPAMVRSHGFYGFPNQQQQHCASYQQHAMQYQQPYCHPMALNTLSDSSINYHYANELNRRDCQLHEVQRDNHHLREQLEVSNSGMAAQMAENEQLRISNQQLIARKEVLEVDNGSMKDQIKELSVEKEKLESSVAGKDTVIDTLSNSDRQKTEQLQELSTENEKLIDLLRRKDAVIMEQGETNHQQEEKIDSLSGANTDLQERVRYLNLQAEAGDAVNHILQISRSEATKNLEGAMQTCSMLSAELIQRQTTIHELQRRLNTEKTQHDGAILQVEKLMDENAKLTNELKDMASALETTMRAAREESKRDNLRTQEIRTNVHKLITRLDETSKALDAATSRNKAMEQEIEELLAKSDKKSKENESRSKRQARLNAIAMNETLSKELEEQKDINQAVETEKNQWQRKFEQLSAEVSSPDRQTCLYNMGMFLTILVVFFLAAGILAAWLSGFDGVFRMLAMQLLSHHP
ncbi:hypothetical protein ONS96_003919 [Cadophora gregata f. sp. sojae]|nr:hypothetical protein ONS96_003919 [Cadophora gregata f. sp. sojae]